ncbi:MAG TPA: excinuclease ABC subunit UvrA [Dissulfurispiraceae bacterium]|nr:excinuclease ABC subunit UvrA [Dissulfurispiraceae bacterium]
MSIRELIIEGARQNNLKNITLSLPHNQVIAVTGVSGSGKSSLAFDTVFAEGQWRFIESLSTYARLFLEKLDRPDVDAIRNIRPSIALEQKNPVKGSRSTVGTLTELYDYFRILYSRVATPYCPKCGKEIRTWDPSQVVSALLESHEGARAVILFESGASAESLRQRGFHRLWITAETRDIAESADGWSGLHDIVVDRLIIRDEPRLADSVELAWREGKESLSVVVIGNSAGDRSEGTVLKFSSRFMCDECSVTLPEPSPMLFSFNHPLCACTECKGFGNILKYDEDIIMPDKGLSVAEGAIEIWEKPGYRWWKKQMIKGLKKTGVDTDRPVISLAGDERELLYSGNKHFFGLNEFFEELEGKRYKLHVRVFLSRMRSPVTCPSCRGKRLCGDALAFKIGGLDIAELSGMQISSLLPWFRDLDLSPMERDIAKEALNQITMKLGFLNHVGLGYLTPSRQAKTLSGGEYQRVNLSNQLASALTGTLYVLDEPTIGLHPRDTRRIAEIMRQLSQLGNTIIVVEHDRDIIAMSDWVVELGPGGGSDGGEIVFSGPMERFLGEDTLTAEYLREKGSPAWPVEVGARRLSLTADAAAPFITLRNATGHNLKGVTARIPLMSLSVVTGVSGSGKSSLIVETLYRALARHFRAETGQPLPSGKIEGTDRIRGVRLIDQSPIGRTPRSNPLTYLKIFDPIRRLFSRQPEAKLQGYKPGFFSFNVTGGRCETCKGEGFQRMEMYFFEDVFVTCEDCKGRRYRDDALRVLYRGRNIADILDMTVDEAYIFFAETPEILPKLEFMRSIGLGYLRLGQPATTLSGGEAQRLKICLELSSTPRLSPALRRRPGSTKGFLYILDEPTIGLHHRDVMMFLRIIRRLVDAGNTVVVIEHNLDVVAHADWVIDLGPEGGDRGGELVFEGMPEALVRAEGSYTGRYLREYFEGA